MALLEIERKILDAVVMRFLRSKQPTLRKPLVLQFGDADAIDHLCQLQLLRVSEGNAYLPPALAFHYSENEEAEKLARRSIQMLAHVLKRFYPEDHPDLTIDALVTEARKTYDEADAETMRFGLYLATEFGLLNGWAGGNFQQLDVSPMGISERIMKIRNTDTLWDEYVSQHIPWPLQDASSGADPTGAVVVEEVSVEESWPESQDSDSRRVFVVHGHDEAVKHVVARFLEKLKLTVIILHEQPNKGRTVIEKFEANSDVGFAVVLLTPDDEGYSTKSPEILKKRARQNVILELGYFIGKLGRQRVCALYVEDVEIPSDINGVLYVKYDSFGGWRSELAKEIKAAGIAVDLNQII